MKTFNEYNFSGEKVLVAGARGFIGSHLCEKLLHAGAEVHAVSRTSNEDLSKQLRWWAGPVDDLSFIKKIISQIKPEYIFHLSGFVSGLREMNYVLEAYHSILTSTINVLTAATEEGCKKIILAGSLEEPDENNSIPSSPYAAAKWACRGYAEMFRMLYGTPVVNPRIFMVYGPGQREKRKLIPYVTLSLLNNEAPKLSSGQRAIDWIYIDDVVDGLVMLAKNDDIPDGSIDIGTGNKTTVKEIVEKLVDITGAEVKPVFGDLKDRPMERVTAADMQSTYEKTDWKPVVSINEGLVRTVDWYKKHLEYFTT